MSTNKYPIQSLPLLIWCCFAFLFMFPTARTGRIQQQDVNGKLITVISDQDHRRQQPQPMDSSSMIGQSDNTMRAASFMVDPLIIIALIALPTIGMLGLSSLVMPLIPIGIYLIQQFFPAGVGRRRRRKRNLLPSLANPTTRPNTMLLEAIIEHVLNKDTIERALENLEKMLQKYNQHHHHHH